MPTGGVLSVSSRRSAVRLLARDGAERHTLYWTRRGITSCSVTPGRRGTPRPSSQSRVSTRTASTQHSTSGRRSGARMPTSGLCAGLQARAISAAVGGGGAATRDNTGGRQTYQSCVQSDMILYLSINDNAIQKLIQKLSDVSTTEYLLNEHR